MTYDPREVLGTPHGASLVPQFPLRMRNTEILTVVYRSDPDAVRIGIDPAVLGPETEGRIGAWNTLGRDVCDRFLAAARDLPSTAGRPITRPSPA